MAHEKGRLTKSPMGCKTHLSHLWVSFKGYSGKDVARGNMILEVMTESSKEFSRIIRTSSNGTFTNNVECLLRTDEEHSFVLYKLEPKTDRSLKIDNINFSVSKSGRSLIHFTLDLPSLAQKIALSKEGKVSQTISSSEGYSVTFEASNNDLSLVDEDEVLSVASFLEGDNDSNDNISLSDFNDSESWRSDAATCGSSRQSSPKPLRVRFDKDIHEIPTTKQLQDEIHQAVEERSKLSKSLEDLSLQLFQMKHEMRDMKESLRHVTDMCASYTRKQDVGGARETRGKVSKRRRVVLDGNVIAKAYGGGSFRIEGIGIALNYYLSRDINAVAVVSDSRVLEITEGERHGRHTHDKERLRRLIQKGLLSITPSQTKREHFILKVAIEQKADVVSNESFRSVVEAQSTKSEQRRLKGFLARHRIRFTFFREEFIPNPQSDDLSSSSHSSKTVDTSDTFVSE